MANSVNFLCAIILLFLTITPNWTKDEENRICYNCESSTEAENRACFASLLPSMVKKCSPGVTECYTQVTDADNYQRGCASEDDPTFRKCLDNGMEDCLLCHSDNCNNKAIVGESKMPCIQCANCTSKPCPNNRQLLTQLPGCYYYSDQSSRSLNDAEFGCLGQGTQEKATAICIGTHCESLRSIGTLSPRKMHCWPNQQCLGKMINEQCYLRYKTDAFEQEGLKGGCVGNSMRIHDNRTFFCVNDENEEDCNDPAKFTAKFGCHSCSGQYCSNVYRDITSKKPCPTNRCFTWVKDKEIVRDCVSDDNNCNGKSNCTECDGNYCNYDHRQNRKRSLFCPKLDSPRWFTSKPLIYYRRCPGFSKEDQEDQCVIIYERPSGRIEYKCLSENIKDSCKNHVCRMANSTRHLDFSFKCIQCTHNNNTWDDNSCSKATKMKLGTPCRNMRLAQYGACYSIFGQDGVLSGAGCVSDLNYHLPILCESALSTNCHICLDESCNTAYTIHETVNKSEATFGIYSPSFVDN